MAQQQLAQENYAKASSRTNLQKYPTYLSQNASSQHT